jgi:leader peptidase (prepilin peptidase) / N-methyltransferase
MVWLVGVFVFLLGLVVGSFMTVVIARVPVGESIVRPRSRCPMCGAEIRNRDNVPVIGWLLLRGRCRDCHARIPVRYPLVELSTAVLVLGAYLSYDDPWIVVAVGALLALLPAISVIDIERRVIPNAITYPALIGFPAFLVVASLFGAPVDLTRMAVGFLAYGGGLLIVALISRGMGMGDVKLAALIGIVFGALGMRYVGVAAFAAILFGGLGGIVALLIGKGRKAAIPFGPYLAAGAVVAAYWTEPIARWYLHAIGA